MTQEEKVLEKEKEKLEKEEKRLEDMESTEYKRIMREFREEDERLRLEFEKE